LPGSLYAHISSKEALLNEIVETGVDSFLAIEESLPPNGTGAEKLRAAIKGHIAVATAHPGRSLVVIHQWRFLKEPNLARTLAKGRRFHQIFMRVLEEGIADGSFDPHLDTKVAMFIILGALNFVPEWHSPRGRLSPEEIGDRVADLVLQGVVRKR
jgi:AcrR family transcriptional regulator